MNKYTLREEKANTLTHAFGILFGLVMLVLLMAKNVHKNDEYLIVSDLVFVFFMTVSYLASTLYHYEKDEKKKLLLRKFDHAAIYSFIAGSYTPFTLVVLRQDYAWGWSIFAIVWITAIAGILLSFLNLKNASRLETICYVAMGWGIVFAFKPLINVLSAAGQMDIFYWLLAGGLFYTVGAVIYLIKKVEFMHAVWHIFVLLASICHAYAIWLIR